MRPLLVSYSDLSGGAARAAFRLHQAFREASIDSRMRVAVKQSDVWSVDGPTSNFGMGLNLSRHYLGSLVGGLQKSVGSVRHSVNIMPSSCGLQINASDADVANLHWIAGETISIEAIGRIRKPVVWTLHDMWAFCGSEHYADDSEAARWRHGYQGDNRPSGHALWDIDRWTWSRKRRAWRKPLTIIAPSQWLATAARQSVLMKDWPVHVVPNVLNTDIFRPLDATVCRDILRLPQNVPLVLFGAFRGAKDPRKGFDLLLSALRHLSSSRISRGLNCVIFGQSKPREEPEVNFPLRWLGHIHDDWSLALLYNAVDVVIVPSRQENLPQTATEAQACGTPVVAFNATGLPDVVVHGETGYLAKPYDAEDLARGVCWILEDATRSSYLGATARAHALRCWGPEVVVPKYLAIYAEALGRDPRARNTTLNHTAGTSG
jgi:glycosyltransferase involved in cell wall biosynthesis